MTLRFRRSVRAFPGVRLNFSATGVSTTIGGRGASLTVGPRGTFVNVGIPRTGISFRERVATGPVAGMSPVMGDRPELPDADATPRNEVMPGEIRSAANELITSVGLRGFRELLGEANREYGRLKSELPPLQGQLASTQGRAYKWQNGRVLRHLLRKKYQSILSEYQVARREVDELQKAIERCRIAVEIEMDGGMEQSYGALVDAFRALAACDLCWDTTSEAAVNQAVERTKATRSITRTPIVPDCRPAAIIEASRPALCFPNANGGDLFILPGLLLVFNRAADFALVSLAEVRLLYSTIRFQEEEGVPSDSNVLGETWKKVNKDGSPDRRFANNFRIPIAEYGVLRFTSAAGLNEEYMFSNSAKAELFRIAFATHQATVPLG